MDRPYLVVHPLDEAHRDFILAARQGDNAVPVALDHLRELLQGAQSLPAQALLPSVEELACPGR